MNLNPQILAYVLSTYSGKKKTFEIKDISQSQDKGVRIWH